MSALWTGTLLGVTFTGYPLFFFLYRVYKLGSPKISHCLLTGLAD